MLVRFAIAEEVRDQIQQRQCKSPAWSGDFGLVVTSDESLYLEGLQAVDIFERLQIVLVPARELHHREVVPLGNEHREPDGVFELNLLRSLFEAFGRLGDADDLDRKHGLSARLGASQLPHRTPPSPATARLRRWSNARGRRSRPRFPR